MRSELKSEVMGGHCDQSSIIWRYKQTSLLSFFFFSLPFYSQMAIEKYNTDLLALTKTCEEMKKLYSVILVILELLFQYLFCTALEMDCPPLQQCMNGLLRVFVTVTPHTPSGEYVYFIGKKPPRLLLFHYVSLRAWARTLCAWYRARPCCLRAV